MKTLYLLLLLLPIAFTSPAAAQKISKEEKIAQQEKAFRQTQELVAGKHFQIAIDRVYPQGGQDVSRFNPNGKITIKDSIAEGHLPFFGRAYSLPYGEGGGIEFNAPMKNVSTKVTGKKKKQVIALNFSVPGEKDVYQFRIDIAPGGNCTINLSSNNRANISYSGTVLPLEEK